MFKIIAIIDRLLIIFSQWSIKREQLKAQRNRDELLKNPADWFSGHFDGLPTYRDTDKTDKTDSSDSKAK